MIVGKLEVLKSANGYYIGRMCLVETYNCKEPYSRESVEYWGSRKEAQSALDSGNYEVRYWA